MAERRATEVREESLALQRQMVDKDEVAQALAAFVPVWDALAHREQTRVMHMAQVLGEDADELLALAGRARRDARDTKPTGTDVPGYRLSSLRDCTDGLRRGAGKSLPGS